MSDTVILALTASAVVGIVVMIVKFRFNPVVSLVVGAAYLGLVTQLGFAKTVETITTGFGDLMAEIGLLVGFGVIMGAILREIGAIRRLVEGIMRVFGPKRAPHAFALTIVTFLQSIYLDVLLVIAAPLARAMARRLGRLGTARMATAMAISLECGIVFTVPGVAALALAGVLDVPLGRYMVFGLVVVVPTVVIATSIMTFLFRRGWWNEELDEDHSAFTEEYAEQDRRDGGASAPAPGRPDTRPPWASRSEDGTPMEGVIVGESTVEAPLREDMALVKPRPAGLLVLFSPLIVSLILIAMGALAEVGGWMFPALEFVSAPVIALLLGLIGTCFVGRFVIGQPSVETAITKGLSESGQILLLNGVGGSLAAMIAAVGLGDILGKYFSGSTVAPLLLVWAIAAALHVAVGSVTISAITSAGLLAPVLPSIGLDPLLVALAAGAGSLFMVHLTSNTFWLLQSLMGQTTRGTLKTCSVGVSVASVIALGPILLLSVVL